MTSGVNVPAIAPNGLDALDELWRSFDNISDALDNVAEIGGPDARAHVEQIEDKIESFEPTVTLIGQIKAGKTALLNAMIGQTDLLPSDVNPWTSVVTSLHINSRRRPEGTKALFRFFDEDEWDRLISTGGRLGELAQRAGFESEQEDVRQQVMAMREKSRDRLGRRFEMLLGTSHNYDTLNKELIDRYVCYGGWDDEGDESRGRFADITKLANLYLDLPGYPTGLCLRDTPGVNDTFMMREQITINSIRDSRLCVVVLSAHQALSTMDMALLRLVANVDARELVLFVNRVDELDDPANQIPEIEANFRVTLKKHDVSADVRILFGSAFWALHALSDTVHTLPEASKKALANWGASERWASYALSVQNERELAWALSGVPKLHECIAERIVEGPGRAMLREVRDEISNLITSIELSDDELGIQKASVTCDVDPADLADHIEDMNSKLKASLKNANRFAIDALNEKLLRAQDMFSGRAVEALQSHLEAYGTSKAWQYNPAGLRMMLRTAYQAFCTDVAKTTTAIYDEACRDIEDTYVEWFGVETGRITLKAPTPARPLPPTGVGKTIALDLNISWWKKWWHGMRRKDTTAEQYSALITKETNSILEELSHEMAPAFCQENEAILEKFMQMQRTNLLALASSSDADDMTGKDQTAHKVKTLDTTRRLVDSLAA